MDWIADGCPEEEFTMRQYTPWASAMGGFLKHHGVEGFLANANELRLADQEDIDWQAFAHQWHELFGDAWTRPGDVAASALQTFGAPVHPRWAGCYLSNKRGDPMGAVWLGRALQTKVGRYFGETYLLESEWDGHSKTFRYRITVE